MNDLIQGARILIVDDEASNLGLLEHVFQRAGYQHVRSTTDPRQVLPLFQEEPADLLLLDLHMPYKDGFEIAEELTGDLPAGDFLPILVLTADTSLKARQRALSIGATDLVTKPFEISEILLRVRNLLSIRFLYRQLHHQNQTLEEKIRERTQDLEQAQTEILERLAIAAEYHDDQTGRHAWRIGALAARIAREYGSSETEVRLIRLAAPLHDVGKIAIPDSILLKPGKLSAEEFEIIKSHTEIGAKILSGSLSPLLQMAEEIARTHHEHWDGTGYTGLKGEAIPSAGRIVAVADVFDALTHDRPYKQAWPVEKAIREIEAESDRQFDPEVVKAFLRVMGSGIEMDPGSETQAGETSPLQAQQLGALRAIAAAIGGSLDLTEVLTIARHHITEQLHVPAGAVYLLYDRHLLQLKMNWGVLGDSGVQEEWVLSAAHHAYRLLETGQPRYLTAAEELSLPSPWRACLSIPLIAQNEVIGVLDLFDPPSSLWKDESLLLGQSLGQQLALAIRNACLFEEVRSSREQMQILSQRLIQVQETERARLARELHDEVGQILTGLHMSLEMAIRPPGEMDRERLAEAKALATELLQRVRRLSLERRPQDQAA